MTQIPPASEPEQEDYQKAHQLLDQLWEHTQRILPLSTGENLPELSQLVLQRGELVSQYQRIAHLGFSNEQQTVLQEKLERCQNLDREIEQRMIACRDKADEQLKQVKQNHQLLSKYVLDESDRNITQNREA